MAGEANAGTDGAWPVIGKLCNGKKRDIGQRLNGNWRLRIDVLLSDQCP